MPCRWKTLHWYVWIIEMRAGWAYANESHLDRSKVFDWSCSSSRWKCLHLIYILHAYMNDNKIALPSVICIFILLLRDWSGSENEITRSKCVKIKAWSSKNIFCSVNQIGKNFLFFYFNIVLNVAIYALLDFAVILQLLTVNKSSKIPYIWFTVNYCNMHCIMGISLLSLQ